MRTDYSSSSGSSNHHRDQHNHPQHNSSSNQPPPQQQHFEQRYRRSPAIDEDDRYRPSAGATAFPAQPAPPHHRAPPPSHPSSRILFMRIEDDQYPVPVETILRVCNPYGRVLRIRLIPKKSPQSCPVALVEFETLEASEQAMSNLQGADIYAGCCTLRIEFSQTPFVKVREGDPNCYQAPTLPGPNNEHHRPNRAGLLPTPMRREDTRHRADYDHNHQHHPQQQQQHQQRSQPLPHHPRRSPQIEPMGPHSVLLLNNLNAEHMTCKRIFNLFCLYGNVYGVKFLASREGCAMVEVDNIDLVSKFMRPISQTFIFGQKISVAYSRQHTVEPVHKTFNMPADGSPSYFDFSGDRSNRYTSEQSASKNRPVPPTRTLYYYNMPPDTKEQDVINVFQDSGALRPIRIKQFPPRNKFHAKPMPLSGLAEWDTVDDATTALVLANNTSVSSPESNWPYVFKLAFSTSSILVQDGGHSPRPQSSMPPPPPNTSFRKRNYRDYGEDDEQLPRKRNGSQQAPWNRREQHTDEYYPQADEEYRVVDEEREEPLEKPEDAPDVEEERRFD